MAQIEELLVPFPPNFGAGLLEVDVPSELRHAIEPEVVMYAVFGEPEHVAFYLVAWPQMYPQDSRTSIGVLRHAM